MSTVLTALAPVFLIIAIGWGARQMRILSEETWGHVNRFGYLLPYPAFLFSTVAGADLHALGAGPFLIAVLGGFLFMAALALGTRLFIKDGPAFTSVFQGAVRWNGFVILAAGDALFGPRGSELVALAFGPLVLMVNLLCVPVLARWGAAQLVSVRAILAQMIGNPLILSCAAGLLFNAAGWGDLGPISAGLHLIGQSAMPLALACVGAGLEFGPLKRGGGHIAIAAFLKLIIGPLVLYAAARLMGLDPVSTAIACAIGATSTAAAAYTLAREMGGDARLMAGIITATTLLSFITLPIAITLSGG
ncbi:MAG: AEC family transporter [Hyphomonadaceae bacterium]